MIAQTLVPHVGVEQVTVGDANDLLTRWAHYLGPCNRPFGQQAFALHVNGSPVSVAVSASVVSSTVTDHEDHTYRRGELVELARLCSAPDASWATRVLLRLWREALAPAWPYWLPTAAIAYSQNDRHDGRIYRFDGWTKVRDNCGSSGGGAWSRKRYATEAAHGRKTLWVWRYDAPAEVAA